MIARRSVSCTNSTRNPTRGTRPRTVPSRRHGAQQRQRPSRQATRFPVSWSSGKLGCLPKRPSDGVFRHRRSQLTRSPARPDRRPDAASPRATDETDGGAAADQTGTHVGPVTNVPGRRPAPFAPADDSSFIGRYEVRQILGQGGYGRVYLAYDSELDRLVAIKIPLADRAIDARGRRELSRRGEMLARLSHPISCRSTMSVERGTVVVTSSRAISTAATWPAGFARARYSIEEAAALIAALADALHYTHTHDLFHRDIKPANILIDASGRALPGRLRAGAQGRKPRPGRGLRRARRPT